MTETACRERHSRRLHAAPGGGAGSMKPCVAFLAHACSLEDSHRVCRVKNDVNAAVSFTPDVDAGAPLQRRRPRCNACKRERDERVVARKRQTQKTPGGLVAAHQGDRFELVEEPAGRAEIAERARAFLRARPPFPFDAGMIN